MNRSRLTVLAGSSLIVLAAGIAFGQDALPEPNTITGSQFVPETRALTQEYLEQLTLPEGFEVTVFAENLGNARMMVQAESGTLYVSRPGTNDVIAIADEDGDGVAEEGFRIVATDVPIAHGLAILDGQLYIAGEKEIFVADILEDGDLGELALVAENLPDGDQHGRRTIDFGPDGALYVNLGSSCNACLETNPENATLQRIPLTTDEEERSTFASGLRNTLGFAWHPETQQLWGFDHGTDWRGDDQPPEELNLIEEGSNYGWPICYGEQQVDVYIPYNLLPSQGISNQDFCQTTAAPALTYQAHSAPIDVQFYTGGQFPEEYANDAFVTMRGSWNRFPATGYEVVHVDFDENGQPTGFNSFLSGFLVEDGTAQFARIAGLVQLADGSLLVSDDTNGVLYRVAYNGA